MQPAEFQPGQVAAQLASALEASLAAAGGGLGVLPRPPCDDCPFWEGYRLKSANGGWTNYVHIGPSDPAPLVVCVHGLSGSIATFELLLPSLLRFGCRVLAYDLYGFGMSQKPRNVRLDVDTFINQLGELLDSVASARPVFLLGHSMGGVIAAEFARRMPDRVTRMLLSAPAGLLKKAETPHRCLLFSCLRRPHGCILLHAANMLTRCFGRCGRRYILREGGGVGEPDVREPQKFREFTLRNKQRFASNVNRSVTVYLGALRSMPLWEDDFCEALRELAAGRVPILFVWGDEDGVVPWSEVQHRMHEIFGERSTSCILIESAGHGICLENAHQIAEIATCWFTDHRASFWSDFLARWHLHGEIHQAALRNSLSSTADHPGGCVVSSATTIGSVAPPPGATDGRMGVGLAGPSIQGGDGSQRHPHLQVQLPQQQLDMQPQSYLGSEGSLGLACQDEGAVCHGDAMASTTSGIGAASDASTHAGASSEMLEFVQQPALSHQVGKLPPTARPSAESIALSKQLGAPLPPMGSGVDCGAPGGKNFDSQFACL
eukprot:TRINITY_DN55343_c0_g1_i1.p1 TRINITY_DN55343_c0_g1~~TRINITY_DN55343_c0_g1_i1.p1  ORF type:complete len:571 (+),score=93.19 TRINITY_DN55343_c0_g1_i1:70-1713(+)